MRWRDLSRVVAAAVSGGLAELPRNDYAFTYTIPGFDGTPYLTRTLLPRVLGLRGLIHRIWRDDADPHPHNHPWGVARFLVLSGGYTDERWYLDDGGWRQHVTRLEPGDVNQLDASSFHRVVGVRPDTWTIGVVGDRVQDWGFLVDGDVVSWRRYFSEKSYVPPAGASAS